MVKFLLMLVMVLLVAFVIWRVVARGFSHVWHGLHRAVGIEVGTPSHALPSANMPCLSHQPTLSIPPNSIANDERSPLPIVATGRTWQTKHGKVPAMFNLVGVHIQNLDRMPTEAVIILDRIHDKITRYQAWRQQNSRQSAQGQTPTAWLTERQFVLNKLVSETIPEAVNQYDQIAQFHPHQLSQVIHDNMTAGDILIAVLLSVDGQIDGLLGELYEQASQQLATTYRYVKSRTQ